MLLLVIGMGILAATLIIHMQGFNYAIPVWGICVAFLGILAIESLLVFEIRGEADSAWSSQTANAAAPRPDKTKAAPLVLIAGGDVFMRSALHFHLARAGFRIEHASNQDEALIKLAQQPAVILLDLGMPKRNDRLRLRDIRRACADAKLIPLTRNRHPRDAATCRKLGAYAYLSKPVDPDDVVQLVADALTSHSIADAGIPLST